MSLFFQAEDGRRVQPRSRGLGDGYKRRIQSDVRRAAVPGNMRYLVAVILARGIGKILGFLVSVSHAAIGPELSETHCAAHGRIHSADFDIPQIDHRPLELIGGGHGDNLVFDLVVIGVHTRIETAEMRRRPLLGVRQADVGMGRGFRVEVFGAGKG